MIDITIGSEKQIKWAKEIRDKQVAHAEKMIASIRTGGDPSDRLPRPARPELADRMTQALQTNLARATDAKSWIDMRNSLGDWLIEV